MRLSALRSGVPRRSGTFTVSGPRDNVRSTAPWSRMRVPASGSLAITVPRFTVSL